MVAVETAAITPERQKVKVAWPRSPQIDTRQSLSVDKQLEASLLIHQLGSRCHFTVNLRISLVDLTIQGCLVGCGQDSELAMATLVQVGASREA